MYTWTTAIRSILMQVSDLSGVKGREPQRGMNGYESLEDH